MERSIAQILNIMEDFTPAGMVMMPGDPPDSGMPVDSGEVSVPSEALDLAKQLINMAGSAELARDIIDKVSEAEEILSDVIDTADIDMISRFANDTPEELDFPNPLSNSI